MKKSLGLGLAIATAVIIASLFVPVCSIAVAQQAEQSAALQQSCPVTIHVKSGAFGEHVNFKNQATQPITGIVFHSVRVNAVGEEVGLTEPQANVRAAFHMADRSEQTFSDEKGLAPNAEKSIANNMAVYGRPQKGDWFIIYTRAVRFADGTVWNDDGSHSCRAK